MSQTMIALGGFRFSMDTAAYQELTRSNQYRWQSQDRISREPALQFIGVGQEKIELAGIIYPHYRGGVKQIDEMRKIAGKGDPLLLIDGLGFVWGQWVIVQIDETSSMFIANGQPQKQTFKLTMNRYGEDRY